MSMDASQSLRMTLAAHTAARGSLLKIATFLACGSFAAAVNLVSRFLLTPVMGYSASIIAAYLIGMAVAFFLFRAFVFGCSENRMAAESYRFAAVNAVALVLVWSISLLLADKILPALNFKWHAEDIAHFIGTCVPAVTSYLGHSLYTFRKN